MARRSARPRAAPSGPAGELEHLIATRTTQTNEVNRCVYLAAGLVAATADRRGSPVALVELGASAGLLLGIDRYATSLTRPPTGNASQPAVQVAGDPSSPVRCEGIDRSPAPAQVVPLPEVTGRAGVDRSPVSLDDEDAVRWLRACLWPDVPGRVERFAAACDLLRPDPPPVLRGDLVDEIGATVEVALRASEDVGGTGGPHVVVHTSWALTYVEAVRRPPLADRLAALAREVEAVSWLTAEPPGAAPGISAPAGLVEDGGGTVLGLRRWRSGRELEPLTLGTCNPHGTWVDLVAQRPPQQTS